MEARVLEAHGPRLDGPGRRGPSRQSQQDDDPPRDPRTSHDPPPGLPGPADRASHELPCCLEFLLRQTSHGRWRSSMSLPSYETLDGSTPEITPLAAEHGRRLPLSAFT